MGESAALRSGGPWQSRVLGADRGSDIAVLKIDAHDLPSVRLGDSNRLAVGDYVVHVEHGVGQFLGVREIPQGDTKGDYMLLEYAGGNKLYVPLARMDLVQRFRGEGETKPQLDRMGGATWARTKTRIKTKMRDMAEELLKLYAQRKLAQGFSFSADSNWQREFEDAFEFTETRDQKTASRWTACSAETWVTARPKS